MDKRAIVAVSFGSSYEEARKEGIEPVESRLRQVFQEYDVYRAFTSEMIRKKLKERDGIRVPDVADVLEDLCREGYGEIIVQPLHIVAGYEYEKVVAAIQVFETEHPDVTLRLGKPLLFDEEDYPKVVEDIRHQLMLEGWTEHLEGYAARAVVFMGHGTSHLADESYRLLARHLREWDDRVCLATVEGSLGIEGILEFLKEQGIAKVELRPFTLVAGDHARYDLAGEEDSWKSLFAEEGFEVTVRLTGLGQYPGIQDRFVSHCVASRPVSEATTE